jgi:hypothetical protein
VTPDSADPSRFVRWTSAAARRQPDLLAAVESFEPLDRSAAVAAAEWLRESALEEPPSATTYLVIEGDTLSGFYALAASRVELRSSQRVRVGAHLLPTVPAYLIAQIARARSAPPGTGERLILHGVAMAREASSIAAAVALVVDPFDADTARLWASLGFRNSLTDGPAGLRRMWVPLG